MGIGFRAYRGITRPDRALIERFAGLPVANIADNMNRLYCVDAAIKSINGVPLLGCAFTVKTAPGDNLMIHKAMHMARPGDILVVDGGGYMERALIGEIMVTQSAVLGLGGWVLDGMIRDGDDIRGKSVPVYARGVIPRGPYKNGPGEINVPVCIGGQVVLPGDILVGDGDGIVVIRPEDAPALAQAAREQFQREQKTLEDVGNGIIDTGWIEESCAAKHLEILE